METCSAEIQYLIEEKIFVKKVLLCGITKEGRSFVSEIVYSYPTYTDEHDSDYPLMFRSMGNAHIRRCDAELKEALKQFKLIIVSQSLDARFLKEYCTSESNLAIVTKSRVIDTLSK